ILLFHHQHQIPRTENNCIQEVQKRALPAVMRNEKQHTASWDLPWSGTPVIESAAPKNNPEAIR
ncbi:MAG: hypothetical protein U0941_27615, partial [Planctomycetaceae bacterium]